MTTIWHETINNRHLKICLFNSSHLQTYKKSQRIALYDKKQGRSGHNMIKLRQSCFSQFESLILKIELGIPYIWNQHPQIDLYVTYINWMPINWMPNFSHLNWFCWSFDQIMTPSLWHQLLGTWSGESCDNDWTRCMIL